MDQGEQGRDPALDLGGGEAHDALRDFDALVQSAAGGDLESREFSERVIALVNDFYEGASAPEDVARDRWQRAAMFVSAATVYTGALQQRFGRSQQVLQQAVTWVEENHPGDDPGWAREAQELLPNWLEQEG